MRYPDFNSLNGYANELRDALRRRKHSRKPRVRVRIGGAEPRVLAEGSEQGRKLLELAERIAQPNPQSRSKTSG